VGARFIVFEGGEGAGKSTQARLLAERLGAELTREPGGSPLGEHLRSLLLEHRLGPLDPRAELLLVAAARAQHVAERIRPALAAGRSVVCDRFSGSTLAYQGYGRGLPLAQVEAVCRVASDGLVADLTILLDVPLEVAASRRAGARDRIEAEDPHFHRRVAAGFHALAAGDPDRWAVIDGTGDPGAVHARVLALLAARFEEVA
jgi:dTMP kinase